MKVFGIGMWKTGTTSLEHALERLGFKHLDNIKMFGSPSSNFLYRNCVQHHTRGFLEAPHNYDYDGFSDEEITKLKNAMDKYDCFTDHPWMWGWKLAYELYPNARFILTLRKDNETLAKSSVNYDRRFSHNNQPSPHKNEDFILRYTKHNEAVRSFFNARPNAKYMEICFEKGQGWKELCEFVDKKVPSFPFPHSNKGKYK
jgi:hypothetical protein